MLPCTLVLMVFIYTGDYAAAIYLNMYIYIFIFEELRVEILNFKYMIFLGAIEKGRNWYRLFKKYRILNETD